MARWPILALLALRLAYSAGDPARGRELFRSCSGCHNTESDEKKMGPSLRSLFGKVTLHNGNRVDDDNVRALILDGYNGMPSFRYSFRAAEIDDLMAFLHTLRGKPAAPPAPSGAAYFKAWCARCHDPESRSAAGPDLRGRFSTDWVKRIEEGHALAPPLKDWLEEPARTALIEYLKAY